MQKRFQEQVNCANGLYNLSGELREKLDQYDCSDSTHKICEFLSWSDFCEIFSLTHYFFFLDYRGKELILENRIKEGCRFTIENNGTTKGTSQRFGTPQLLLENAQIDGKFLKEIWDELT